MDMDGCADNPCGMDLQCYDLPAPSDGYTCGECPQGSQLDSFTGRCIGKMFTDTDKVICVACVMHALP